MGFSSIFYGLVEQSSSISVGSACHSSWIGRSIGSNSLVCLLCFVSRKWFLSRKCNIFKMIYDDYLSDTKAFTENRQPTKEHTHKKSSNNNNKQRQRQQHHPKAIIPRYTYTHSHMLNRINSFCIIYIGIYGGKGL